MTRIKIDLPDDQAAALAAKAKAQGLTVEEWFQKVAAREAPAAAGSEEKPNPQEWALQFDEWVDSHDPDTPVLSDEAMTREHIYPDRS